MKYQECYAFGKKALIQAGIEEAELDARLLLEYACGTSRNDLLVHGSSEVADDKRAVYEGMIRERAARKPLQHITGVQEFMGLDFLVNRDVLIPRQDTEILVEEVLKELHDGMGILDMCTGSGCILISLLKYSNGCSGTGADISEEALSVARENGERLIETAKLPEPVRWIHSDLFNRIQGKFDVIVSNPPYIRSQVIQELMPEVRDHEPLGALDGQADGLFFYERIIADSRAHLVRGGRLYFEIGWDQAEEVCSLMERAGFIHVEAVKDYGGLDRVVHGVIQEAL